MTDLERLLDASLRIERYKTEAILAAEAIVSLTNEVALLRASLRIAECRAMRREVRWPINDLGAHV